MAILNFSFAGESIKASRLASKVRKFELEFENPAFAALKSKAAFSVEYFFTIDTYAENLSEAFYMAAGEAGVTIEKLGIHITGNLDSALNGYKAKEGSRFNKIDVALAIVSDAPDALLERVLKLANELNPVDEQVGSEIQFRFSLNTIVHLN